MRIVRHCKICSQSFSAIKSTQFFCSRKCFKRDYYLRNKEKQRLEDANPQFPLRTCAYCGDRVAMMYDPIRDPGKFDQFQCQSCSVPNKIILQYVENPRSDAIIAQMVLAGSFNSISISYSVTTTG